MPFRPLLWTRIAEKQQRRTQFSFLAHLRAVVQDGDAVRHPNRSAAINCSRLKEESTVLPFSTPGNDTAIDGTVADITIPTSTGGESENMPLATPRRAHKGTNFDLRL